MAQNAKNPVYYKAMPGSRDLQTSIVDSKSGLKRLETASGDEKVEVKYEGETLYKGPPEAFPTGLYDNVMPGLDALEQAVLGHLYRLSFGEGANWARAGKKELERRSGLSSRRLLKALSGLAEKGIIRPLHRDIKGTLYKLYTVDKIQPVSAPKPAAQKTTETHPPEKKIPQLREKPLESPINEEVFPGKVKVLSMREIALEFFRKAGKRPTDSDVDAALAQITYLLEDGYSREEVRETALFLADTFGKSAEISKMPYYIHQVIGG